jgi:hypothetical protein
MIEAYCNEVEAFFNSLERLEHPDGEECWRTPWHPADISQEQFDKELESGVLSPAALAKLRGFRV